MSSHIRFSILHVPPLTHISVRRCMQTRCRAAGYWCGTSVDNKADSQLALRDGSGQGCQTLGMSEVRSVRWHACWVGMLAFSPCEAFE